MSAATLLHNLERDGILTVHSVTVTTAEGVVEFNSRGMGRLVEFRGFHAQFAPLASWLYWYLTVRRDALYGEYDERVDAEADAFGRVAYALAERWLAFSVVQRAMEQAR